MMDPKIATFDPWARQRPEPRRETVSLPESGLTLELVQLDPLRTSSALAEAASVMEAHLTGEDREPLVINSEEIELNELLVREICFVRHMLPREQRPSFVWLLGLALNYPDDYGALTAAGIRLSGGLTKNSATATTSTTA